MPETLVAGSISFLQKHQHRSLKSMLCRYCISLVETLNAPWQQIERRTHALIFSAMAALTLKGVNSGNYGRSNSGNYGR